MTARESSDPYYDLVDDFDLVAASFQSQYGIRVSREASGMSWQEFRGLLSALGPETPLGRVVSIRAENDSDVLKHFTREQHRIRNAWRQRKAAGLPETDVHDMIEQMKNAFIEMALG